ncbi:MAG: hypothetical protein HWD61_14925 [Parachlamydiaceae bacterium]|nr:MAG: hypothetical protein HWD61_14925 [Parachlamydiaceae bacterium]
MINLASDVGVWGAAPQEQILYSLSKLSNLKYHPREIQETLNQLKELYEKSKWIRSIENLWINF